MILGSQSESNFDTPGFLSLFQRLAPKQNLYIVLDISQALYPFLSPSKLIIVKATIPAQNYVTPIPGTELYFQTRIFPSNVLAFYIATVNIFNESFL